MKIKILQHARERMREYGIEEALVKSTVENPDNETRGRDNRVIAQKKLDGYVLRVIYEKYKGIKTIITVYKAKRERYEI